MLFLFQSPIELISTLVLILIIILVFNPWGLKDKLFEYVKIDVNTNKIFDDLFDFIKNLSKKKIEEGFESINTQ